MSLTDNAQFAEKMRVFRNHGITTDFRQREEQSAWFYDMEDLGYNYRITDIQCSLGISQLKKLASWLKKRQELAKKYDDQFANNAKITLLKNQQKVLNAYHLYIIKLDDTIDRNDLFQKLKNAGIGINIHYKPVYLHSYYKKLGYKKGLCPIAENAYDKIISLPIYPTLTDEQQNEVISKLLNIIKESIDEN